MRDPCPRYDKDGRTALRVAVDVGSSTAVKLILQFLGSVSGEQGYLDAALPLYAAVRHGDSEIVQMLCNANANAALLGEHLSDWSIQTGMTKSRWEQPCRSVYSNSCCLQA